MFHEVFDPVIDKSLSVFILEQPYDTFKLDLFASYVASLISQDLSAYRLRAEECDRGTVVVAVWDKKPHDSIVSRCQRKSRAVADFMDGTRATEIELYFEGRRELIELKKLP